MNASLVAAEQSPSRRRRAGSRRPWRGAARAARLAALAVVLLGAAPARGRDKAAAEALFRQGKALMDAGRYAEACEKLQASVDAELAVGALLNLALCHEQLGKIASAWAEYQQAAQMAAGLGDRRRERGATDRARKLEASISRLFVQVAEPVPGLEIARNGVSLGEGSWNSPLPVDPGEQELVASAPGYEPWTGSVVVGTAADTQTIVVPMLTPRPLESPTSPQGPEGDGPTPLTIGGGVVLGVGLVGIAISAVLGGMAADEVAAAEDDPALCPERSCSPAGRERIDQAAAYADGATAAFVVGGAALVAGIVMLIWPDDEPGAASADESTARRAPIVPVVTPSGVGLTGRF